MLIASASRSWLPGACVLAARRHRPWDRLAADCEDLQQQLYAALTATTDAVGFQGERGGNTGEPAWGSMR